MKRSFSFSLLLLSCCLLLSACGGGGGGSEPASQSPANRAPRATDLSVGTNESQSVSETLPATDADGDMLTYAIANAPQKGQVAINNPNTGTFTYTPNGGELGTDSFGFTASDGTNTSNTGTVSININGIPTAAEVSQTISNAILSPWDGILDGNDPDGDALTYNFLSSPSKGTLTSTNVDTGAFTYQPNSGQTGTDGFQYEVSDGLATSNVEWVIITFNAPPTAADLSLDALQDQANNGVLQASDPENDGVIFSVTTLPVRGTVSITNSSTGEFSYSPDAGESGSDSFTFTANDPYSPSNSGTVDITIYEPPNVGFVDSSSYATENKIESVVLNISPPVPFEIAVNIEHAGSATAVEDYEFLTQIPLTVPPASTEAQFDVSIIADAIDEDESLDLTLTTVTNARIDVSNAVHSLIFDDWRGSKNLPDLASLPGLALQDILVDSEGNIFICGWIRIATDNNFYPHVIKYDKRGVEQWQTTLTREITGTRSDAYPTGLGTDSQGNIVVAGTQGYPSGIAGFVAKLDPNGNELWFKEIFSLIGPLERGGVELRALTTDASNNIFLAGRARGKVNDEITCPSSGSITNALLTKIDSDGNTIFTRCFGSTSFDVAQDVAVGSGGQIYVSGRTSGGVFGITGPGASDIFLVRFSADGTPEWTNVFGSIDDEYLGRMSLDSSGNVYLAGKAEDLINRQGNSHEGLGDAFIAKFSSDGIEQWIRMVGGPNDEYANSITLDAFSNSYVTGHWNQSHFATRYDSSGSQDWLIVQPEVGVSQPSGTAIRSSAGLAIVEDSKGNFFVLGQRQNSGSTLIKMDSAGTIID